MKKRNKIKRIAPRPRNAPKLHDDGMRHFIVSVPKNADPEIDQAARDQVADTIEASVHPQRFTDIQATPKFLAPDPEGVAASMKRLHDKLGIPDPDAELTVPAPDYSGWFEPGQYEYARCDKPLEGHKIFKLEPPICGWKEPPPQPEGTWRDALLCIIGWGLALFLGGGVVGAGFLTGIYAVWKTRI